jgi:hypothetical protein
VTFLVLEFGTGTSGTAPLGDIAASLVSIDELLRDLAAMAAAPSTVEYRNIEVVAIEMRSPLRVTLSLLAISAEAVKAFQDICRDIMLYRERRGRDGAAIAGEWEELRAKRLAGVTAALRMGASAAGGEEVRLSEQEAQRLQRHMWTLQDAAVPLRRVEVREE